MLPLLARLTSGLNAKLSLVTLLAGHGEPAVVWVLNPLSSLAVEQTLIHRLQLVNGQPVGRCARFVQPQVPRCHPLPVRSPRPQNKVSREGHQLLRWGGSILRWPKVPTHWQVSVLHCGPRHLAGELQCVTLHLRQSLGWSRYRQRVSNDWTKKREERKLTLQVIINHFAKAFYHPLLYIK